jgi:hypothetical protein
MLNLRANDSQLQADHFRRRNQSGTAFFADPWVNLFEII